MKSIFTKTLIAAAIAGVASVNAATISSVDTSSAAGLQVQKISSEGYAELGYIMVGDTTTTNDVTVTWEAGIDYQANDFVSIIFDNAELLNSVSTPGAISLVRVSGTGSVTTMTGIGIDADEDSIRFRTGGTIDTGDVFELRGVRLGSVGSTIAVSAAGRLAGDTADIDQAPSTTVATMGSQFALAATSGVTLDRTIDVENSRKQFVTNGTDVTNDTVTYTLTNSADLLAVTVSSGTFTLEGSDLSFLEDGNGDLESGRFSVVGGTALSSGTGAPALNDTGTEFSFTTSAAPAAAFGVTVIADGVADADGQVLAAQEFEAEVSYAYGYQHDGTGFRSTHGNSTDTVMFTDLDAGEWTLSGANVDVEFMPFGSGITQFIYITNDGNVSGDVEVTAIDQSGTVYGPVAVDATATAKSVTNVTNAVISAMTDAGVNTSTGRVALTLTVNSPSADIEVTAGYNSRGNRVLIK